MILTTPKQSILDKYILEATDLIFCDLVLAGWGRIEAAFFAYGLAYEDKNRIRSFLRDRVTRYGGIEAYMDDRTRERDDAALKRKVRRDNAEEKERREFERRVEEEVAARLRDMMEDNGQRERLSKEDLGNLYTDIIHDPTADPKTKMDAAKNYTALYQMNKVEEREEDTRIHFYLPLTCSKCALMKAHRQALAEGRGNGNDNNNITTTK